MKRLIYLISLLTIIVSCSKSELKNLETSEVIKVVDSVKFDDEFGISQFTATNVEGEAYFLLANFTTFRELKVYDGEMNYLKSFNLSAFEDFGNRIQAIELLDLSTAIVLTYNSKRIFYLNDDGYIFKVVNFEKEADSLGVKGTNRNYLYPFLTPDKKRIILNVGSYPPLEELREAPLEKQIEVNEYFMNGPRVICISDLKSEKPKVELKLSDLFKDVLQDDELILFPHQLSFSNENVLSAIMYSNKLKVYNEKFELEEIREVNSDFVEVGVESPKVAGFEDRLNTLQENAKQKGVLIYSIIDEATGNTINVLYNYLSNDKTEQYPNLIIYSKDWKKLEEITLPNHQALDMNVSNGRYYLRRKKSNIYDVFEFVEN